MTRTRVLVAMSGGVDSAVAAALLQQQGHDVIGVTMNIWPEQTADEPAREDACCSLSAAEDARRVADLLGIPHYVLNLKDVFARRVIDNFFDEYAVGRTPNPCVRCNQHIKFDALWPKARALDAAYIATGHYARVEHAPSAYGDGGPILRRAADARKDQSYVLYTMGRRNLGHTLLPLGEYTKEQVRAVARALGLPVADKVESQEICFVSRGHYSDVLRAKAPAAMLPGPIVDEQGREIGRHAGIAAYTVGQRKGLALHVATTAPRFVLAVLPGQNTVVAGPEGALYRDELLADELILTSVDALAPGQAVQARIRYRATPAAAHVWPEGHGRVRVIFVEPQKAITPGQAVVFYDGDVVLGGATISAA
jgi:tRNA-specific 2-thiouridylase